jgi:hypothetical protein
MTKKNTDVLLDASTEFGLEANITFTFRPNYRAKSLYEVNKSVENVAKFQMGTEISNQNCIHKKMRADQAFQKRLSAV